MGQAAGNATKAAILAGYSPKSAARIGYRLTRKVHIQSAIGQRAATSKGVMTRARRQEFWSDVSEGRGDFSKASLKDRLKASELLGKSQADFIERHEHDVNVTVDVSRARERLAGTLSGLETRITRAIPESTE